MTSEQSPLNLIKLILCSGLKSKITGAKLHVHSDREVVASREPVGTLFTTTGMFKDMTHCDVNKM